MSNFKIAFYIRCSTEEQGLHANPEGTIKNQEQRLRYELEARNRTFNFGSVAKVFIEDGLTAKNTKRPEFQKLMRAVELGDVNLVMVTENSRLCRNMRDFASMWEFFKSHKCSLISLRENFDTSTAAGEMMLYNVANLAQYESRMTSERVTLSRFDRAQRGLFNGGVIPLGYKKAEKAGYLELDEDESKVIKLVFETFLRLGSLLPTAKWLNENQIRTPRLIKGSGHVRVGHFTVGNVRCFLINKAYIGVLQYKRKDSVFEAKAAWPAIIEEQAFMKVQSMLKENHRKKKTAQKSRYPYTLSGLVFCKLCNEVMCGKSAHGRNEKIGYYEHSWSMRKDAVLVEKAFKCGMHKRVPARLIEPLVHEQVEKLLLDVAVAREIINSAQDLHSKNNSNDEKEKAIKRDYSACTTQLEALTDRLAKMPVDVPADEIYKAMRLLSEKRDKAKAELEVLQKKSNLGEEVPIELKDYEAFLAAMKLLWFSPRVKAAMKEKIIKMLVARIEIDTNSVEIQFTAGKTFFNRESKGLDFRAENQMTEKIGILKNVGSSTCKNGAQDWT